MPKLYNRAKMTVSSTGTGTLTLGSALNGFQSFASAGVQNGDTVSYVIEDVSNAWEFGTGTYTSTGTSLTRSVTASSNSNTAINVTSSAIIYITALSSDMLNPANNLSDLGSASTARTNLGLGSAATQSSSAFLQASNNLSEVTSATARTNLGLGTAAILDVGTSANNVVQLTSGAALPAVSGQNLTNISVSSPNGTLPVANGGTGATTASGALSALGGIATHPMIFGNGSDGDVTISSGTTTLTRDMYYNNLTISGTGSINTKGWRVFVAGTLDISSAPSNAFDGRGLSGINGGDASSSGGGTSGTSTAVISQTNGGAGTQGGNGRSGVGNQQTTSLSGTAGSNNTKCLGGAGGDSGTAGRTNSSNTDGLSGGTVTAANPMIFPFFGWGTDTTSTTYTLLINGGAGGSGAPVGYGYTNAFSGGSGAGGNGGRTVVIVARTIARGTNTNTSIISVAGGNGSNAGAGYGSTGTVSAGGSGGGGGGGGGFAIVAYAKLTGSSISSAVNISGGNGGNGANRAGTGTSSTYLYWGGSGGSSGAGGQYWCYDMTTGLLTKNVGSASVAATAVTGTSGTSGATATSNTYSL